MSLGFGVPGATRAWKCPGPVLCWTSGGTVLCQMVVPVAPLCLCSIRSRRAGEHCVLEPGRQVAAVCFPGRDTAAVVAPQGRTRVVCGKAQGFTGQPCGPQTGGPRGMLALSRGPRLVPSPGVWDVGWGAAAVHPLWSRTHHFRVRASVCVCCTRVTHMGMCTLGHVHSYLFARA